MALVVPASSVTAVAVNAATDLERWPWGLDLIQRHPFAAVLVSTVVGALLALVVWRLGQSAPPSPAVAMPPQVVVPPLHVHVQAPAVPPPNDHPGAFDRPGAFDALGAPDRPGAAGWWSIPDRSPAEPVVVEPPVGELPELRGREGVVRRLLGGAGPGDGRVRVVAGLGGCGKTTVALAVTDAARARGWPVWWVSAVDAGSLVTGMLAVATAAGATAEQVAAANSDTAALQLVWDTLRARSGRWLLVIDNADDPGVLAPEGTSLAGGTGWARDGGRGVVLVTTRVTDQRVWGNRAVLEPLGVLDEQAGALMLLDRVPTADPADQDTLAAARRLSTRLGHLPLALHLAGSYLGSGAASVDLAGYPAALDAQPTRLLQDDADLPWAADDPRRRVPTTWELSLDALAGRGVPQARTVLRLLAMFAPGVPVPLSIVDGDLLAAREVVAAPGRAALTAALVGLRSVGLLESAPLRELGTDGVAAHPLVAEVSRLHARRAGSTSACSARRSPPSRPPPTAWTPRSRRGGRPGGRSRRTSAPSWRARRI